MLHADARDLALHVAEHWGDVKISGFDSTVNCGPLDPLPELDTLEYILSCCYQASLMR